MADLSGKVAVIVDAADGLGRGIAEGLAEAGATLYLTAPPDAADAAAPPGSLESVVAQVGDLGGRAVAVAVDSACEGALTTLLERIQAEQGRLDVLVTRVGVAARELPRLAAPVMVEQGSGLIVCLAGWEGDPESAAAGRAPRTAAELTGDLGRELVSSGIAALALQPAVVRGAAAAEPVAPPAGLAPTSMRFNGRCVAALAMDPDILDKTGGVYRVTELQREYRFSDPAWT